MTPYNRGTAKPEIAVIATTIIMGALTICAWTAASPKTIAPTMLKAWPIGPGRRTPPSRMISNNSPITNTSTTAGKGTPCLEAAMLTASLVGIRMGWYATRAR